MSTYRNYLSTAKKRARRSLLPRVLILLYHRVTELDADPEWLSVTPAQFEEHLDVLYRDYRVISLAELRYQLRWGTLPNKRSVVITFDDGYLDNLYQARPLLEKYSSPATVFVTSGKIDCCTELWWDELAYILLEIPQLPPKLNLQVCGKDNTWCLNGPAPSLETPWNVSHQNYPTPRHKAYKELAPLLRVLPAEEREAVMDELALWAGVTRQGRSTHRVLNSNEIIELTEDGLVDVGAHTVTHPVLSMQTVQQQHQEIAESKTTLETILGRPVTTFAYPFGGRKHYTQETVDLVRQAGFTCACSNFPEWTRWGSDPFQLPRYLVRDWDGDTFAQHLKRWFDG